MIRRSSAVEVLAPQEEEEDGSFSEILYTKNQVLPPQDFSLSQSYSDDFMSRIEKAVIFPNMTNMTLEEMVEDMLVALSEQEEKNNYFERYQKFEIFDRNKSSSEQLPDEIDLEDGVVIDDDRELQDTRNEFTVELAMNSVFVSETVSNLSQCIQRTLFNDYDGVVYDDSWFIMLCELQSINHRKIVIARLSYDMYIMPTCQAARCAILILANSAEKGMKSALQTGTNFGTILSLPNFVSDFVNAQTTDEIIQIFKTNITRLQAGQAQMESIALSLAPTEKGKFACEKPFAGIRREVAKRLPYYFSDFTDGLVGFKTRPKLVAAIIFQYFATILPIIALGQQVDMLTDHRLTTKTVIYSQFFGSILYGMFSGNPMMIFQVSSVILLYSKGLYAFSKYQGSDFKVLFGLTGSISGGFLVLIGIFNISNYMVYSTSSVADMVDVFQFITFAYSVMTDVVTDYDTDYDCDHQSEHCVPAMFVLNLLLIVIIIIISNIFRRIRSTGIFNITVREFMSDMWITFGVLATTLLAAYFFRAITLHPFSYLEETDPFFLLYQGVIEPSTVLTSFILAIPLTLLIFLDHNLNGEFISDPRNKLHKGRALHFDMFVVGLINSLFGFVGLCSMQGIFPNTPLHIKQMADVEETLDQGVTVKTLVRVRDTRISQVVVGILVGVSIFLLPLPISFIPRAALNGLLLVIGYISMEGNGMAERLRLVFVDQSAFPSNHPIRKVAPMDAHKFSFLQICQLLVISIISFSEIQNYLIFLFPVALALLIPFRIYVIPHLVKPKVLELLDPAKI